MHINHLSLSKLSQTAREVDAALAQQLRVATPPHSSKTRKEEASKQLGNRLLTNNSSSHRLNNRRSDEIKAKVELKHKLLQQRCSLKLKSLRKLTIIRSSLQESNKTRPLLMNTWIRKRQLQFSLAPSSLQLTRVAIKPQNQAADHPRQRVWSLCLPLIRALPHRPLRHHNQQPNQLAMAVAANAGKTSRSSTNSNHKVQRQAPLRK